MPAQPKAHRASAQRRRDALLEAAAQLSAELGAGAVTHRAVAARAGVPLSTTSYFFSSIDDLVTEALRRGSDARAEEVEAIERFAAECTDRPVDAVLEEVAERVIETPRAANGDHVEFLLAAGRQEELRSEATGLLDRYVDRIGRQLDDHDAPQAESAAWTIAALGDGAMLYRLAEVETDHRARLAAGLRLVAAAAMLTDDEVAELLARYCPDADTEAAAGGPA